MLGILLIGFVILVAIFFFLTYNSLITQRARINNAWSQIDVQLKRRYDLVPNLVQTVKGYAKHEKSLFKDITKARAATGRAKSIGQKAKADNMLSETLKSILAVAENYPKLRANENFMMLQEELAGIESKIAYARQFYNDSVLAFNTAIQTVPTNIVAGMFSFTRRDYFKAQGEERKNVKVKF